MSNLKPNKGQILRPALRDFCSMLIEEASDITGLSFEDLDGELDISNSYRFFHQKRSKNINEIQELEGKVAKLLRRTEHKIVLQNQTEFDNSFVNSPLFSSIEKEYLRLDLNFRQYKKSDLEFSYELGWPTYWDLKYHRDGLNGKIVLTEEFKNKKTVDNLKNHPMQSHWTQILLQYSWQWGVLWDEGEYRGNGLPWLTKQRLGIPKDKSVENYLSDIAKEHNETQMAFNLARLTSTGKRLCDEWEDSVKIKEIFETEQQLSSLIFEFCDEELVKKIKGEALYLIGRIAEKRSPDILTLERQYYENRLIEIHKGFLNKESEKKVIIVNARIANSASSQKVRVKFLKSGNEILFQEILTDVTHPKFKINDSQNFDSALDMDYIRSLRNLRF